MADEDVTVNGIARWSGATSEALGSGFDHLGYALAVSGTDLYAAGTFYSAGAKPSISTARWSDTPVAASDPVRAIPQRLHLAAEPRPFVEEATLQYVLPQTERVRLVIYDVNGARGHLGRWWAGGGLPEDQMGRLDRHRPAGAGAYYANLSTTRERTGLRIVRIP